MTKPFVLSQDGKALISLEKTRKIVVAVKSDATILTADLDGEPVVIGRFYTLDDAKDALQHLANEISESHVHQIIKPASVCRQNGYHGSKEHRRGGS